MRPALLFFILFATLGAAAQPRRNIEGRTVSAQDEAVSGVSVMVSGREDAGILTDQQGHFKLTLPRGVPSDAVVEFRHIGFEPRDIRLDSLGGDVRLVPRVVTLAKAVVSSKQHRLTRISPRGMADAIALSGPHTMTHDTMSGLRTMARNASSGGSGGYDMLSEVGVEINVPHRFLLEQLQVEIGFTNARRVWLILHVFQIADDGTLHDVMEVAPVIQVKTREEGMLGYSVPPTELAVLEPGRYAVTLEMVYGYPHKAWRYPQCTPILYYNWRTANAVTALADGNAVPQVAVGRPQIELDTIDSLQRIEPSLIEGIMRRSNTPDFERVPYAPNIQLSGYVVD